MLIRNAKEALGMGMAPKFGWSSTGVRAPDVKVEVKELHVCMSVCMLFDIYIYIYVYMHLCDRAR